MSKVLSVPFFADTAFFNDVTITSSLRSVVTVVQVLLWYFTSIAVTFYNFSVTLTVRMICAKIMKSCLNFSKLRPKYYRFLFFWTCIMTDLRNRREPVFVYLWITINLWTKAASSCTISSPVHSLQNFTKRSNKRCAIDIWSERSYLLSVQTF